MFRVFVRCGVAVVVMSAVLIGDVAFANPMQTTRIPVEIGTTPDDASTLTTAVVEKGDHLWKISATHLANSEGNRPTNREIAPYWRKVIETNRESLRSGNPDLIYPGEVVELPPASEQP